MDKLFIGEKLMSYTILVVFSCPNDQARLRLDREHRYLQKIIDEKKANDKVKILQAATINDLIKALSYSDLKVVHFSGHGSHNSIYLEKSGHDDQGEELSSIILSKLLQEHCPHLETLILSSCYSSESIGDLIKSASKVITVEGAADDDAAIEFTNHFYTNYLNNITVDKSIVRAQLYLEAHNLAKNFRILVKRRGSAESEGKRPLLQAVKNKNTEEPILIDINEIEPDFNRLHIPREEFISLLISKLRVHQWLVLQTSDMEHAILSFGKYHALFSWKYGMDLIKCKKIIRLKKEVSDKQTNAWLGLAVRYNQLFSLPYRSYKEENITGNSQPHKILNRHHLRPFKLTVEKFFSEQTEESIAIRETIHDDIKMFAPTIIHNFNLALEKYEENDFSQSIIHLETTLSAIHSVLELLTESFSE